MSELPEPYIELSRRFEDGRMRARDLEVVSREPLEKDGLRAQLIKARQTGRGERSMKWLLVTGDMNESMVVTGTFPLGSAAALDRSIEAALRDLVWESSQSLNHFEGLSFRLSEIPGLRISTRVSNTVVFTRDGRLPDKHYTGPLLIVRFADYEKDAIAPKERRAHAEEFFRDIEMLEGAEIDETTGVLVARLRGYEVTGRGQHRFRGYRVSVLQTIAYDDERFFVAQGFGEAGRSDENFDLFRTVIGSLTVSN